MRVQSFIIVMAFPFASSTVCFAQNSTPSPAASTPAPTIFKSTGRPLTGQSVSERPTLSNPTLHASAPAAIAHSPAVAKGHSGGLALPAPQPTVSTLLQSKPAEAVRRPVPIRNVVPVSHDQSTGTTSPTSVAPAVAEGNRASVGPSPVTQVVDIQPPAGRVPALPASASRGVQLESLVPMAQTPAAVALPNSGTNDGLLLLQPILPRTAATVAPTTQAANVPYEVLQMTRLTGTSSDQPIASASPTKSLNTESMIGPLGDPSALFGKLNTTPVPAVEPLGPVRTQLGQVPWAPDIYTWVTPTFYHKPLYFEQPNLERYGMGTYRWLQPAASSAHFFSSIALMPYKVLTQHPLEHVYTLGYDRPGNCAAWQGRPLLGQSTVGEACKVYDPYSGY